MEVLGILVPYVILGAAVILFLNEQAAQELALVPIPVEEQNDSDEHPEH